MNEQQMTPETGIDKALVFFKKHIYNILLFVIAIAFLFKDVIEIKQSGKTIPEIIASAFISFAIGTAFNVILGKKGIIAGKNTKSFMDAMYRYSQEIEKTDEHIEKLDSFCEMKNEQRLRTAQIRILRKARIKYEDFMNKPMEEVCTNEEQIKYWDKAVKVRIQHITADNLLSETDERYEKGKKELTLTEYETKQNQQDAIVKIIFAIIFGYFGVAFVGNLESIIWGVIQISVWLLMAIVKYVKNYSYVTDVHKAKIHRKINLLIEFNMMNKKGGQINGE
jgi:hypothetical protein